MHARLGQRRIAEGCRDAEAIRGRQQQVGPRAGVQPQQQLAAAANKQVIEAVTVGIGDGDALGGTQRYAGVDRRQQPVAGGQRDLPS